ncbi:TPA: hypothetical protein VJI18_002336 [Salmonella enterica subsp. salamae serovar 48:z:e,n,x,z15]|nr:hypothetical protein [Salmonella enterica subsp. salamae serovar 48:z:e,n,x,z15]
MKLSIDFWEVISLLLSFVGLMFAAGKLLLAQIEKRLNERFEALEAARREDYLRGQAVLEAKLDALYSKIELIQRGNH